MAAKIKTDEFANTASITVTETGNNTLTYVQLQTGIGLNEKVAWIINRIEYYISSYFSDLFNADNDELHLGVSQANVLASQNTLAAYRDPALIDKIAIHRCDLGVAASGFYRELPIIKDFSSLPGGGLIMAPVPLFGFAQGVGLASASSSVIKLFYTQIELAVDQYWQLVEARRGLSV